MKTTSLALFVEGVALRQNVIEFRDSLLKMSLLIFQSPNSLSSWYFPSSKLSNIVLYVLMKDFQLLRIFFSILYIFSLSNFQKN